MSLFAAADPIAQIRADYARIMQVPVNSFEFQCPTDPFAGSFSARADGELEWLSYRGGHEHGALGLEALSRDGAIVFVMETESSWSFDPNPPAEPAPETGDEPTIDTEIQERYYFQDGESLEALYKKTQARSAANERIEAMVAKTKNVAHPNPKYARALARAKNLIAAEQAGAITKTWCGLE